MLVKVRGGCDKKRRGVARLRMSMRALM